MNKKALASGIVAFVFVMFFLAIFSLVSLLGWNTFNDTIQSQDNATITPVMKEQIDDLSDYMNWGEKIFVIVFIILLASYMISSITLPVDQPIYFIIFLGILAFTCVIAMIFSNTWTYLIGLAPFNTVADQVGFIDFFMRNFPLITFFTGIIGAVLFYGRKQQNFTTGGDIDGFE